MTRTAFLLSCVKNRWSAKKKNEEEPLDFIRSGEPNLASSFSGLQYSPPHCGRDEKAAPNCEALGISTWTGNRLSVSPGESVPSSHSAHLPGPSRSVPTKIIHLKLEIQRQGLVLHGTGNPSFVANTASGSKWKLKTIFTFFRTRSFCIEEKSHRECNRTIFIIIFAPHKKKNTE